jgi:tRNA(fMet)-specific endonuclease VapC
MLAIIERSAATSGVTRGPMTGKPGSVGERDDASLRRRQRTEFFRRVTAAFQVFGVTAQTATTAAAVWSDLVRSGTMIGAVDLLIAATALERDWSLATLDARQFGRVPGLLIVTP